MKSKIKAVPLYERIIVEVGKLKEKKSEGGIIIADTIAENVDYSEGTVVAVGKGYRDGTPLEVKVGDEVIFPKYAGKAIELQGREYVTMKEAEIYAIS